MITALNLIAIALSLFALVMVALTHRNLKRAERANPRNHQNGNQQ